MQCHHCPSADSRLVLTPEGPHHGKHVCARCGKWITWAKRPAPSRPPLVQRPADAPLPLLRGTPAQVPYVENVRGVMLRKCRIAGLTRTAEILSAVVDATWFLSQKDRALDDLRWPDEGQMSREFQPAVAHDESDLPW